MPDQGDNSHGKLPVLALGALGIVFGDIGTSPLYALKESFVGHHPLAVDADHIFGVLSLIFWTMMLLVTLKYVFIIMRADNKGEFKIKDKILEQFQSGSYPGEFLISKIYPHSYTWYGKITIEIRAMLA
ncbi:DUF3275 family protein, partial [Sphingobium sp.]|uniref:DUF3275 family protein n=1 Tax=Sphingobium sp. TaxID=1912891 RepID=UPI002B95DD40